MKKCIKCSYELADDAKFCPKCGAKQDKECHKCHAPMAPDDMFCPNCGASQEKKVWLKFAKMSKTFGILGLALCFTSLWGGLYLSIVALVFGILGSRSSLKNDAKKGKVMGIIGIPLNIVFFVVYMAIMMTEAICY